MNYNSPLKYRYSDTIDYDQERNQRAARFPEFDKASRVHDWRNYISDKIQSVWESFTIEQRIALIEQADEIASNENWD